MNIKAIQVGPFDANCYVTWNNTPEALVIDPGGDPDVILKTIRDRKLHVAAYLLTHGHMDHIHALADVCDAAPAPVAMHGDDLAWSFTEENILPPYYTVAPRRPKGTIRAITGGQEYTDGGLHYKVLHTPGHAPGCVCFYFETSKVLFTGDTLFAGSVGRTDLPGGSSTVLTRSLASLARLPDDTVIYPGHGPDTTMAREKRTNYFMQQ